MTGLTSTIIGNLLREVEWRQLGQWMVATAEGRVCLALILAIIARVGFKIWVVMKNVEKLDLEKEHRAVAESAQK